jgi:hypothetical protein
MSMCCGNQLDRVEVCSALQLVFHVPPFSPIVPRLIKQSYMHADKAVVGSFICAHYKAHLDEDLWR